MSVGGESGSPFFHVCLPVLVEVVVEVVSVVVVVVIVVEASTFFDQ